MDLHHFFDGMQSKEQSASAFLATLLEYDAAFRAGFLASLNVDPPIEEDQEWTVQVEAGDAAQLRPDITLAATSGSTLVLIENKIRASAFEDGQLLGYYRNAANSSAHPPKRERIVSVLIDHDGASGPRESMTVSMEISRMGRDLTHGDAARSLTWRDIEAMIAALPADAGWFATSGIAAVKRAIGTPALPAHEVRDTVRRAVMSAHRMLRVTVPDLELHHGAGNIGDSLRLQGLAVSLSVEALYPADRLTKLPLVIVGPDGRLAVRVATDIGLPLARTAPPLLATAWARLVAPGEIQIGTVGRFRVSKGRRLKYETTSLVTEEELTGLVFDRARQALDFVRPFLQIARTAAAESVQ